MIQDKTLSAENGCCLFKGGDAVLGHLAGSLWAGREAAVRGVAPLAKDAPLPARHALRPTAFRLAESVNTTLEEY